jgi:sugar lactone lactonase YvrE
MMLVSLLIACAPPPAPWSVVVTHLEAGELRTYDADTRTLTETWRPDDRDTWQPAAVRAADGDLLVSDFLSGDVLRVGADGAAAVLRSNQGATPPLRLEEPCALAWDDGALLVLGNDSRNLLRLDAAGGAEPVSEEIRAGHALAVPGDGTVWIGTSPVRRDLGLVQRRDLATGALLSDLALPDELDEATALLLDGPHLLVADWFRGEISAWDPASGRRLHTVLAGLDGPVALRRAPTGDLLVLDRQGLFAWDGAVTTRWGVDGSDGWTRDLEVTNPDAP